MWRSARTQSLWASVSGTETPRAAATRLRLRPPARPEGRARPRRSAGSGRRPSGNGLRRPSRPGPDLQAVEGSAARSPCRALRSRPRGCARTGARREARALLRRAGRALAPRQTTTTRPAPLLRQRRTPAGRLPANRRRADGRRSRAKCRAGFRRGRGSWPADRVPHRHPRDLQPGRLEPALPNVALIRGHVQQEMERRRRSNLIERPEVLFRELEAD